MERLGGGLAKNGGGGFGRQNGKKRSKLQTI